MQLLLHRLVTLAAAEFVFTEPHSKRLKLRLRLRREVLHSVTLEQAAHVVEFTVHDRLCDACGRARADPVQWSAVVQLRQRVSNRRTLLHLEQQLISHGAADSALRVDATAGGLDFFLASQSHAAHLVDFVSSLAPARSCTAKQLVSHDTKNNTYHFKHIFSVELCPVCRDDLVFLPREASRDLGGFRPLVLCVKVTNALALLDTSTLRAVQLSIKEYDRYRFEPVLTSRQLVEYVVLDVEPEPAGDVTANGSRYVMAYALVAHVSDLGKNDTIFTVRTHLGHLLNPGDHALGYDLYGVNVNSHDVESYGHRHCLPDAVLVKKSNEKEGKLQDGRKRDGVEIEEIALGIGCIDLNPSDEEEL